MRDLLSVVQQLAGKSSLDRVFNVVRFETLLIVHRPFLLISLNCSSTEVLESRHVNVNLSTVLRKLRKLVLNI